MRTEIILAKIFMTGFLSAIVFSILNLSIDFKWMAISFMMGANIMTVSEIMDLLLNDRRN